MRSIALAAALLAGAVLAGCGSTSTSSPPASHASRPVSSAGQNSTTRSQLTHWFSNGGQTNLDQTIDAAGKVHADLANKNHASLVPDCIALAGQAQKARNAAPIPDAVAQAHWSKAIEDYYKAGDYCSAAVPASAQEQKLSKVSAGMQIGNTEFQKALERAQHILESNP